MKNHPVCPITGQPCNKKKFWHITDIAHGKVSSADACEDCIQNYVQENNNKPDPPEADQVVEDSKKVIKTMMEFLNFVMNPKKSLKNIPAKIQITNQPEKTTIPIDQSDHHIKCENCGTSIGDIAQNGRLGCIYCYEFFGEQLMPMLQIFHGSSTHVGKIPKKWKEKYDEEQRQSITIKQLLARAKAKMDGVIANERYEDADCLKKNIETLIQLEKENASLSGQIKEALKEENYELAHKIKEQIKELVRKAPKI